MKVIADENALSHWGILGMRWGFRRTPEQLGHKPKSEDRKKTDEVLKKTTGEMSNQELNDAINRILKEKQLRELTAPQESAMVKKMKELPFAIGRATMKGIFSYNIDRYAKTLKDTKDPKKEQLAEILKMIKQEVLKKDKD